MGLGKWGGGGCTTAGESERESSASVTVEVGGGISILSDADKEAGGHGEKKKVFFWMITSHEKPSRGRFL